MENQIVINVGVTLTEHGIKVTKFKWYAKQRANTIKLMSYDSNDSMFNRVIKKDEFDNIRFHKLGEYGFKFSKMCYPEDVNSVVEQLYNKTIDHITKYKEHVDKLFEMSKHCFVEQQD